MPYTRTPGGASGQAADQDLTDIAALTATTDNIIQSVSSAWASRTPAQVKTALNLGTGSILLPLAAAIQPDGSASNTGPAVQRVKSSASAPAPYFMQAAFDAATKEQCMWAFRMPANYSSAPVLKVQYKMASATSGDVIIEGRLAAVTDGDATDVDAKAFGSANTSSASTVAGTAGYVKEISLALANADSVAAGDFVVVYLARDAANGGDTATGDMEVVAVSLTYTI